MQIPSIGAVGAGTSAMRKRGQHFTGFGGYNHTWSAAENEFYEMENLSSRDYPMLSTRKERSDTVYSNTRQLICADIINSEEEPESALCTVRQLGANAAIYIGADEDNHQDVGRITAKASYVYQAGYIYYLPRTTDPYSRFGACRISTLTEECERELLGSKVTVERNEDYDWNLGSNDTEVYKNQATFRMQPCDSSGVIATTPKAYRSADGRNTVRNTNQLIIIDKDCSAFNGFNEHGVTAFINAEGEVYEVRRQTKIIPSDKPSAEGAMLISGHGAAADWVNYNISVGNYVTVSDGQRICVYESKGAETVAYLKPENPTNGARWRDSVTGTLYVYSSSFEEWSAVTQNYIHFSFYCHDTADAEDRYMFTCKRNGIPIDIREGNEFATSRYDVFAGFRAGDCIEISGMGEGLDGSYTIRSVKDDGLVLNGVTDKVTSVFVDKDHSVTVRRRIPTLDFVIESGNRLWGCYYGKGENGETLNEIYCSALGDPFNWYRYDGNAADSWVATVGVGGRWTGAAVYGGYPIFFKENAIIRIYGTAPSSFQTVTYNYRGVKEGSAASLCVADEVLYWQSVDGIVAYTGALPEKIDHALGDEKYSDAACGSIDGKLYVSTKDTRGKWHLFVYDSRRGLWHREDGLCVKQFLRWRDELYMVLDDPYRAIKAFSGGEGEKDFEWYCVSGNIGYSESGKKYLGKVKIRAAMPFGSEICVKVSYDGGEYEDCGTWNGEGFPEANLRGSGVPSGEGDVPIEISFIPRRCEAFRIRLEGRGQCRIISEYFEIE